MARALSTTSTHPGRAGHHGGFSHTTTGDGRACEPLLARSLLSRRGSLSKHPGSALIQSIALWQFDVYDTPTCLRAWTRKCSDGTSDVSVLPVPDRSCRIMGLRASHAGAVVATVPLPSSGLEASLLLVIGCSDLRGAAAAVEHWGVESRDDSSLVVRDAWYSESAMPMARLSRHSRIKLGFGLPGLAAQLRSPVYMGNLAISELFVRAYSAMQLQLLHGLAVPTATGREVLVMLTAEEQGMARRVELSAVQANGLRRLVGHCRREGSLASNTVVQPWGANFLQACACARRPCLLTWGSDGAIVDAELQLAGAQALLALPFEGEEGHAVVLSMWF